MQKSNTNKNDQALQPAMLDKAREAQRELMEYSGFVEVMLLYYRVVRTYHDNLYLLYAPITITSPHDYKHLLKQGKKLWRSFWYIKSVEHKKQMIEDRRLMLLEWILSRLCNLLEPYKERWHPATSIHYVIHKLDTPEGERLMKEIPGSEETWKTRIESLMSSFDDEYEKIKALRNKLEHQH